MSRTRSVWNKEILRNLIKSGKYILYGGNKLSRQYDLWLQIKQEDEIQPMQTQKCVRSGKISTSRT